MSFAVVMFVVTTGSDPSDEWMQWECPGFPCMVVNYFEYRDYTDIKQTCTPVHDFQSCTYLKTGTNYPAVGADGEPVGWHNSTQPHPCAGINWGCLPSLGDGKAACLQGSNSKCRSLCDDLNLLDVYQHDCFSRCDVTCPVTSVSV